MNPLYAIPTVDYATSEKGSLPIGGYAACANCVSECDIWGVTDQPNCVSNWSVQQRNNLLKYLRKANDQLRDWMGWSPIPQWVKGERIEIGVPVHLKYGHLLSVGCPKTDVIATGVELTYSDDGSEACFTLYVNDTIDANDPNLTVTGTPELAAFTDACEVEICHVGSDIVIVPSSVTWEPDTGALTVCIPRCRLVKLSVYRAQSKQQLNGIWCDDDDSFATTIDLKRTYADPEDVGRIVCTSYSCCGGCQETFGEFCVQILDKEQGLIQVNRTDTDCCCECGNRCCYAEINYLAGGPMDETLCSMIVGAAHAMMPTSPCAKCELLTKKYEEDRQFFGDVQKLAMKRRLVRAVWL